MVVFFADAGTVGGWNISSSSLSSLNNAVGMSSTTSGISFWSGAVNEGQNPIFYVDTTGYLYAENASVSGAIYANRGYFSGLFSHWYGNSLE